MNGTVVSGERAVGESAEFEAATTFCFSTFSTGFDLPRETKPSIFDRKSVLEVRILEMQHF